MAEKPENNSFQNLFDVLPGQTAWQQFAPVGRFPMSIDYTSLRLSAVAILLFPGQFGLSTLFLQRTVRQTDNHSGQISFPGGKKDDTDPDLIFTAMRELEEETGIKLTYEDLIGSLTPLPVPVSRFMVHPFVFYIDYFPTIYLSPDEAVSYFEISMNDLNKASNHKLTNIKTSGGMILNDVPYFDVIAGQILWGATAMITAELLSVLNSNPDLITTIK